MRKVIHIDADCFFAAIEMRENPPLTDVPMAVGGSPESRGVIATCNYPARKHGIHSAMATSKALKLCPSLIIKPVNMPLYKQVSEQMMKIITSHAKKYEIISIDEAYLELDAKQSAKDVATQIKHRVLANLGIRVSAGAAENKLLAKIASDYRKPDGLTLIHPSQSADFIKQLEVKKIPGVGQRFSEKLAQMGIYYCHEAQNLSLEELIKHFGKSGWMLHQRCRGIDNREVSNTGRERKSISLEHTFKEDIKACDIHQALPKLWQNWNLRVAQKSLHQNNLSPFVKVKFSNFKQTTYANHQFTTSLEDFAKMLNIASNRSSLKIRLIGIGGRIEDYNQQQLELFKS